MKRLLACACLIVAGGMTAYGQWVQTNGPQGAIANSVVADDSRIIIVTGTDIYQNIGSGWTKSGSIREMGGFYYQSGGDLVAFNNGVLVASAGEGICRSTDFGKTWTKVMSNGALATDGSSFYLVQSGSLFKSSDGAAWSELGAYPADQGNPVFFKGAIIASEHMQGGLRRSVDGGATWEPMANDIPVGGWGERVLAAGADALYASGPSNTGVFRSSDGAQWTDITNDLQVGAFIYKMSVKENVLWVTTSEGLFRLNGTSWQKVAVPNVLVLAAHKGDVIAATARGVYKVDPEKNDVTSLNDGIVRSNAWTLGAVGDAVVTGTNDGIYRTLDGGASWERVDEFYSYEFIEHRGVIYSRGGGVFGSDNQGRTWRQLGPYWEFEVEGHPIRSDLTGLAAYDGVLYLGAGSFNTMEGANSWSSGGIFRSTNNGITWTEISDGLPIDCATYTPVGDVVAGEGFVVISTAAGMFRSTDRGGNWRPANNGLPITNFYNHGATLVKLGGTIYYFGIIGNYESSDAGLSWTPLDPAIPDGFRLGTFSIVGDKLYTTADKYTDTSSLRRLYIFDGASWKDITHTEPAGVMLNGFAESKGTLYAGSQQDGVWKTADPAVVRAASVRIANGVTGAKGTRVAPNPVLASAQLSFTLPARTHTTISLVDALGQTVGIVRDGMLEAGAHQESIDMKGIAAGTYFVRIETAGATHVERLVKVD